MNANVASNFSYPNNIEM